MRIGIDLGGSKIEGIALDPSGVERARIRVPAPQGDYAATVTAIANLVAALEAGAGTPANAPASAPVHVGVGIPGTISPDSGLVKNANSTWLIGKPLHQDLAAALARPVRLANDANCFAMSEATDGAGQGAHVVFGVILGTGVGGGLVIGGRLLTGANAIAGEWGHNPLPWPRPEETPGPACYCGLRGCIETFLSGPALAADTADRQGGPLGPAEIATLAAPLAAGGDAHAAAALRRYEHRLARALASVINVVDPDVIVLGGGLSNIDRLYHAVPPMLAQWVFSDHVHSRLVRNRHGDASGVRGAAWLWPAQPPP